MLATPVLLWPDQSLPAAYPSSTGSPYAYVTVQAGGDTWTPRRARVYVSLITALRPPELAYEPLYQGDAV
jgi:hypothetical protein